MITLRPFTAQDWEWYDAEPFADGSDPLVGSCALVGDAGEACDAVVVADAHGLIVQAVQRRSPYRETFIHYETAYAARALAGLRNGATILELVAMPGAQQLS